MKPGDLVADRFLVERLANTGGMGAVYRAIDRHTGEPIALKMLHHHAHHARGDLRFAREARVLAELQHPGIVRYVAHGTLPGTGEGYLAIEWLEGMDLAARLARKTPAVAETVTLGTRIAEALGTAHARGVVHRDVKPSNLFLPDGDLRRVKVLDFGVARLETAGRSTRTGAIVGTPAYMAPEQVRGEKSIDARVDVFALGCVLFECLTGKAPFVAEHVMAVLAKILLEETPRIQELASHVPRDLADLVGRMLSKEASGRPADGAAVAAELGSLGTIEAGVEAPLSTRAPSLTAGEQRLLCVVLAGAPPPKTAADTADGEAPGAPLTSDDAIADTVEPDLGDDDLAAVDRVRAELAPFGARVERLIDGSMIATLAAHGGSATDQAAQAARCALAMRVTLPDVAMALTTGRGWVVTERWPVGEVIDRAVVLLRLDAQEGGPASVPRSRNRPSLLPQQRALRLGWGGPAFAAPTAAALGGGIMLSASGQPRAIRLDEVTAGLLDVRFDVRGDASGLVLQAERELYETTRTLLGKPTPCVGRERELGVLEGLFDECVSEQVARAVLLTAAAGVGKSRLRHELIHKLKARNDRVEVWVGRGDPMSAGSPFGMIAPAVRRTAGIFDGEPLAVRRQKLRARLGRHLGPDEVTRIAEFLGELIGAPFPDEDSVYLRAARQDAMLMGDQMRRAFEDFLAAECAAQPLVLVLEDLHWGDLPSVQFIDGALRNLDGRPLLVLALARPEVREIFPRLWEERAVHEMRLSELTRKGSERLVRQILGPEVPAATVERVVSQAAGNAFYLEELIRAVAEGKGDGLPETVLAMVESRLEGVEADSRRVLRAASVFGQVFWSGGLAPLLGGAERSAEIAERLTHLVDLEIITRRSAGKFPGQTEYTFRQSIVREAAYGMLPPRDRTLGHKLAAEWLERAGESEPVVLAEHFERGGEGLRAVGWYWRAAEQALESNDLAAAVACAERGVACGATGEVLASLRLLEAKARRRQDEGSS